MMKVAEENGREPCDSKVAVQENLENDKAVGEEVNNPESVANENRNVSFIS